MPELESLPANHPDRNRPIAGAQLRSRLSTEWRTVRESWAISKYTYNELTEVWTFSANFRWPK